MRKILMLGMLIIIVNQKGNSQSDNTFPFQVKAEKGTIEGNYDTHSGIVKYFGIPIANRPIYMARLVFRASFQELRLFG